MLITSLPVELAREISTYLQLSDLQALRSACRYLYRVSLDTFSDRYFTSIRFLATSDGLRNLEEITKLEIVRKNVRELWMIPTVFDGTRWRNRRILTLFEYALSSKSCNSLRGAELKTRFAIYTAMTKDSFSLLKSKKFSIRLRKCLDSLTKLDTIGLAHYTTQFLLDPRQQKIRFLGWRQLRAKLDCRFSPRSLTNLRGDFIATITSLAMLRILQAIGPRQKIRKLHTCGADNYGDILSELNLPQSQYRPLLSMLEDLRICIYYQRPRLAEKGVWDKGVWDLIGFGMLRPDDPSAVPTWFDVIIEVAPRLKTLAFSQGHYCSSHQTLYQAEQLSESIQFTQLRELHLHWIHLTSGTLKSFLNTAKPTLRVFTLFAVSLDANEDLPINDPITSMSWQRLWDFFRDELSLQKFSMGKIASDPNKYFIQGPDRLTKPSENAEFDAETAGTSFSEWIDSLTLVLINGYHHLYDREWIYQDEWFDKMIPTERNPSNAFLCTCKDKSRPCRYRCFQQNMSS